jgi:hypothetical protein
MIYENFFAVSRPTHNSSNLLFHLPPTTRAMYPASDSRQTTPCAVQVHVGVVGLLYCMVLVHTFDDEVRKQSFIGKRRPQTFRWIIGSLGIFLADRAWRYYTQVSNM